MCWPPRNFGDLPLYSGTKFDKKFALFVAIIEGHLDLLAIQYKCWPMPHND
jgi:hypothetical protein